MLRTQAMREREEARGRRKYRYCLIRVRFPDGWLVQVSRLAGVRHPRPPQGTFGVGEPLAAVSAWVADLLETPLPHQVGFVVAAEGSSPPHQCDTTPSWRTR